MVKIMSEVMKEFYCPDCNHPMKQHRNLIGCCEVVGEFNSSERFEGGKDYCYCQRLYLPNCELDIGSG